MKNNSIPTGENKFISFVRNNINFNGMIYDTNRKGYKVKYFRNNAKATNFFNSTDECIVKFNEILPFNKDY